jgi:voltage-gated potassium channel Kch
LFQDIVVIPILAVIPILGVQEAMAGDTPVWLALLEVGGVIAAVIIGGHYLLRPILRLIAATGIRELFTAIGLLIVIGTALLMYAVGVSMALGAFMAGLLLADSEYRHELEADIEPFKGLLLGLFFISVGMSVNLQLVTSAPMAVAGVTVMLLVVKGAILYSLGRLWQMRARAAKDMACVLPQGGEFAFVIFTTAVASGVMPQETKDFLIVVVSLSMAATPLIGLLNDGLTRKLAKPAEPDFDTPPEDEGHVIIAGFGRFGQIVGRVLAARNIPFTALDASADQVDFVKKYGNKIYYGDASRLDLLRAAKTDEARAFVLAIDDVEKSLATAEVVRKHFPKLEIYARARNRQHAYRLMDLGIVIIWRETFCSSLELTRDLLVGLGEDRARADDIVDRFQEHDRMRLFEHYTHHNDEEKMQDLAKAAAKELEEMFARDAEFSEELGGDTPSDQRAAE